MKPQRVIGCAEALKHLAAYLDDELGERRRGALERHLEACRSCFSRAEFERLLTARLRELGSEPVPAGLEARVRQLLDRF